MHIIDTKGNSSRLRTPAEGAEVDQWIIDLKQYAIDHYEEDGWDVAHETWSDDDWIDIVWDCDDYAAAFEECLRRVRLYNEYRNDIRGA